MLSTPLGKVEGVSIATAKTMVWVLGSVFVFFACISIVMLVSIRKLIITDNDLIVRWPLQFRKRKINLSMIESIEEQKFGIDSSHDMKDFNAYRGKSIVITCQGGKVVKLSSFEIRNYYTFVAHLRNELREYKWRLDENKLSKLDSSWEGYGWLVLMIIATVGLLYGLFAN